MAAGTVNVTPGVLLFCLWSLVISLCSGINLDARFSVIKKGKPNSYFGFSLAQHQIVDNEESPSPNVIQNTFLIGAPMEKVTLQNVKYGGAIYKCDASDTKQDTCKMLTEGLYKKPNRGKVDDQWLGVSVASQGMGKKAVACAHRFIKDNKAMGRCEVLDQSLDQLSFTLRPCERVPNNHFMKDFGLCQAGMSASIGQEDSLLMGAPGSVFWQGAVFLSNISDEFGVSQTEIASPYMDIAQVKDNEQPTPVRRYSYQGYALAMGRFDASQALYYASGAPKSQSNGEVVFYKKVPPKTLRYRKKHIIKGGLPFSGFGSSLLALDMNNDGFDDLIVGAPYYYKKNCGGAFYVYLGGTNMISNDSEPIEVLSRKMGEEECIDLKCEHARFAISLTKLGDINMDGFEDFAVGAPYEGNGVVYIYHGQDSEDGFTTTYVQRIIASELPVSDIKSFGYSLSGGMDLDGNGYPDLLVGSYESDTVALIRARPIIKIYPSLSVWPKLINLGITPECNLQGVKAEYKSYHCIRVELCLNFTTRPANSLNVVPKILYKIEAEKHRRVSRVELQDAQDLSKRVVEGKKVTLNSTGNTCVTEIAAIKSMFDDKLNPIMFTFSFGLSTDTEKLPESYDSVAKMDVNLYPILDIEGSSTQANAVPIKVDFLKECGLDNECYSNLQFTSQLMSPVEDLVKDKNGTYELVVKDKNELQLVLGVKNQGEPAYLTQIYVQKHSMVSYLGIESSDVVTCTDLKNNDTMIVCNQIGNPLRSDKSVFFTMLLDIPKEMAGSEQVHTITTWVNTSSTEMTPVNDEVEIHFRVINKAEILLATQVNPPGPILCAGEPRGASAISNEANIGASVRHNFIVTNRGPGNVPESYIIISWPYEVPSEKGDGKYLLYLMQPPKVTGPVIKCNDAEIKQYINPLKIKLQSANNDPATGVSSDGSTAIEVNGVEPLSNKDDTSTREKREAPAELRQKRASNNIVVMSCKDKSATCFEYKCQLDKLEPNGELVKITMESRLWESTLLSDYHNVAEVQIISWGQLILPSRLKIEQDTSDDMQRAVTRVVPNYKDSAVKTVQWWVILVSVLAGIIILLIVVYILYKVGFFHRKRPEDMQMYKAEKQQQSMLTGYNDEDA